MFFRGVMSPFVHAGTSISMPPPLMDGQVEYPDGTEATVSQVRTYNVDR